MPKYLVRWKGFGPEDDTIEHLAGAEDYLARFVEEIVALLSGISERVYKKVIDF